MLAHPRPFALPAADADVDVVAFREDPAVASGHVRELEAEAALVTLAGDDSVGDVRLEGDAVVASVVEPGGAGADTVHAVRAKCRICSYFVSVHERVDAVLGQLEVGHLRAIPEVGPG